MELTYNNRRQADPLFNRDACFRNPESGQPDEEAIRKLLTPPVTVLDGDIQEQVRVSGTLRTDASGERVLDFSVHEQHLGEKVIILDDSGGKQE